VIPRREGHARGAYAENWPILADRFDARIGLERLEKTGTMRLAKFGLT